MRILSLILFLSTVNLVFGQCPNSAITKSVIADATIVRIQEIGSEDVFYANRGDLLGKTGRLKGNMTLINGTDCWYSGGLSLENGKYYYFLKVRLEEPNEVESVSEEIMEDCLPDSYHDEVLLSGTRFEIVDVNAEDSYFDDRLDLIGKTGRVGEGKLTLSFDCWYGGSVMLDDGGSKYFYAVQLKKATHNESVDRSQASVRTTISPDCSGEILKEESLNTGTRVEIVSISEKDSYYDERARLIGLTGVVSKENMDLTYDCFYGGEIKFDNGTSKYFYAVQLKRATSVSVAEASAVQSNEVVGLSECAPNVLNTEIVKSGSYVEVVEISSEDSYYDDREIILGKRGIASEDLELSFDCYYGGYIKFDDGTSRYFYAVQLRAIESKTRSASSGRSASLNSDPYSSNPCSEFAFKGPRLDEGTAVELLDLNTSDLYYPDLAKMKSWRGTVKGDLHNNGGCWYGGGITFDNGKYIYFSGVSIKKVEKQAIGFPIGSRVRVTELAESDLYYGLRSDILGKTGTVVKSDLKSNDVWYEGNIVLDNGTTYYFAKVKLLKL